MGSSSLYVSMLRRFLENRRDIASEIKAAIAAGDNKRAQLLSHTLRGISSQVGATTVAIDAENLERILGGDAENDAINLTLTKLETSLGTLFYGLELQLREVEP